MLNNLINSAKTVVTDKNVQVAFAAGTAVGSFIMVGVAKHGLKQLSDLSEKQLRRQYAYNAYLLEKMGPHIPNEVMLEILDYAQTNLMASVEEGIELGVPQKDDESETDN